MRAHESGKVCTWYVKIQKLATANSQSKALFISAAFEILKTPDPPRDNHLTFNVPLKADM